MADISPKKRKRPAEQHHGSGPSKKLAVRQQQQQKQQQQQMAASDLISVSSVAAPSSSPPVIASTSGLILPENVEFRPSDNAEPAPASMTPSSRKRKQGSNPPPKDLALVSDSHRSLDYAAREDKPKGAEPLLRNYVGVFDPSSGSLRIVEARKMVVRGTVRARAAEDEAMAERTIRENVTDMKNELGQAFGTKKAKKAIAAMADNALTPSRDKEGRPRELGASERALMSSIRESAADVATREELQAAVDSARPVPRGNYGAETIQEVYDPREIIGAEILNAIPVRDWQDKVRRQEAITVPSRFVAGRVSRVAANERAVDRLRVLRYMLFLLAFFTSTSAGRGRGAGKKIARREKLREVMAPAPEAVVESIRRKFSDGGEMRKMHADLLMTHWCVFAAIIDGFDVNTLDVREDLRLEQKQVNQYFSEIGARTRLVKKGDKTEHFAKLALPLQFPRLRQHRQR